MRLDEGGVWLDIQRDAEPYFPVPDDLFAREFGRDPQATQWRSFLMVDAKGVAVGTISAWYNRDRRGLDYGMIHWVAVRPAYQGLGLGKAGLAYALQQLAQWHERASLGTQSKRLPAIRMYLNFGFLPDLEAPGASVGWREVKAHLVHPALEALEL
jgi:GNAT superfamily N-acetyltransferase